LCRSGIIFNKTAKCVLHLQEALKVGSTAQTDAAQLELGLSEMAGFIDGWLIILSTVGWRATNATNSAHQANESVHATLMASYLLLLLLLLLLLQRTT
jgi:hypothetical protein